MTDAVIVSTARTPIGKAYRGALNATEGATLFGHAIGEAVARAKVDPKEIEDVVMGAAMQQGTTGGNIARDVGRAADRPCPDRGPPPQGRVRGRHHVRRRRHGCGRIVRGGALARVTSFRGAAKRRAAMCNCTSQDP